MKLDSTKVALITGASSGFGLAIAEHLAAQGVRVVMGDIDDVAGETAARTINERHGEQRAIYRHCDVTKEAEQRALFEAATTTFGGIDIVMNNAGISEPGRFPESPRWRQVIDINFTAVTLGVELAYEYLRRRGGGVVINTASLSGLYPYPVAPVYSASKGAVISLTRALRTWKDEHNIRVNAVAPSFLMPLHLVIEAMERLIVDDTLAGEIARVTPQYGVNIVRWKGKL
ncbi:15-hydroxyprostaglandin dehydrogenase [Syncephalis pseudoplumigaleata]|uniref:15-hydroxyprostaglandin dehydrogenase n=1 Tax=Syncephalis pseudoplumigaleata TaxID=1712513 RepID=A0A4P9Z110_9FUNG|nr:15-hydroxyprostaglandin dehydrogenase [Syncephalis pseudoplumigaleata]|eukprot:RKP26163.1 15-hydroxyprostaglandin dehydrogenase [Syncephalis pseudoplumigaleata]